MLYARTFGWTPRQVNEEVPLFLDRLIFPIMAAMAEAENARMEAQAKKKK